jgi:hypothetical protein
MKDLRLPGAAWLANSLANLHPAAKLLTPVLAFSAMVMPAQAATNLVKNGSFEINGGAGVQWLTTLADWNYGSGLASLDTEALAFTNSSRQIQFWGASPGYQNGNGFTGSPDGGFFWAADGDGQYRVDLNQVVSGLTIGEKYDLSFDYAYGQEACNGYWCNGATNQTWLVYFGNESYSPGYTYVPEHGFRGWYEATTTFTATSTSQTLRFLAIGPGGQPPVALLDGLSLTSQAVPGPLPVVGLGATFAWSARMRKRIKQANRS